MFIKDDGSIRNEMEMRPSERNEGLTVMVVEKSYKSPVFDDDRQFMDDNKKV
jgi:hypothetical protein